jgi:uncharacterized iron-regulated membrane protein
MEACVRASEPSEGGFYRAVWRWHFYAGLAVLPVLLWMAVTGALYLYKPEVELLIYARWATVPPAAAPARLGPMIQAVERQSGATVVQIMRPADPAASWRMTLSGADGARSMAFVDPYRSTMLHRTGDGGVMQSVRQLHSLVIAGPIGNALVEIVAGWAVLLVLTGLYLWWPRRGSPAIGLRGRPGARLFWRDLHASVGLVASAVILFLTLSGMPWTGIAGKRLQGWVAEHQLGRPKPPTSTASGHDHGARETLPWSMQGADMPMGHAMGEIGPDRAAEIAGARGLAPPWTMTLPATPGAPYLVSRTIVRADDARALYLDTASGAVLQDAAYDRFGAGARTIEWGIATHQGQQYGEVNRLVMLAGCLGVAALAITAPILWWKRRRGGRLQAPPRPIDRSKARGVAAIMIAIGALFPLTGATVLAALLIDWLMFARVRPAA